MFIYLQCYFHFLNNKGVTELLFKTCAIKTIVLIALLTNSFSLAESCADVYKTNIMQSSGEFTIYNNQAQPFKASLLFPENEV